MEISETESIALKKMSLNESIQWLSVEFSLQVNKSLATKGVRTTDVSDPGARCPLEHTNPGLASKIGPGNPNLNRVHQSLH